MASVNAADVMRTGLQERLADTQALLADDCVAQAARLADEIVAALQRGNKVFFFGNGGSSMDAGHLAAELLGKFMVDRASLPALSLPDATAAMTAIGNDFSYDEVFARPLRGLGKAGDVAVGLTTSGNSGNVVQALVTAREMSMLAASMTGADGGKVADPAVSDICVRVPSRSTARIQEACMHLGHSICEVVERRMFPESW